ncbi:protein kinase [Isosphaeraceae bacterium EP7]
MNDRSGDPVQELFDRAIALSPERRAAFLAVTCADKPALRAEVEGLLACDAEFAEGDGDEGVFKSPLVHALSPATPGADGSSPAAWPPGPPVRVGGYRVLRRIAEGGMGAVYEAEQDSPRRTVAVKVIRPGLASPALLKRFTHEAQILARLHHPGIAPVYEAGLADDGQPFFAMEFIRGLPLDQYADRHGLDLDARVGLVARVCDAVQHAHDRGVIHRDLKPANILVEEAGQPKVLDFGVARATDADLLTGAGLTRTGQVLGTPNYMSPEQVTADPAAIDRRADVYALGVILFELAAHRLPYRLEDRNLAEAARLILEQDPPRLGSLDPELRGDVETIVAKALEKDPARRYPSAADLAADLRRWLAHEPIRARPPSALYQLRKFARRNAALVGGVLTTVAALVLGLVGTLLFAVGEARQRTQAERNARAAFGEKREAMSQAYRARLAAAVAALSAHDVAGAARQLDAAPEELRGWEWRHLHSRLDDSSSVIPLPDRRLSFLLGAPDRLRVGAFTSDGLRLDDLEGGEDRTLPIRLARGPFPDFTVTPTRRGLRVAAWVGNTAFDLLDEAGRRLVRVERPGNSEPHPVVVSPDGTRLACHWDDGEWRRLVVFDTTSGKPVAVCEGHRAGIYGYTFSPDGTRLASFSEDQTACLWDPATGALIATCRGHASKLLDAAFRPDGARLVTSSGDGTVRQWDAATGREVEPPYDRHSGEVAAVVYSPDGQWVASGGGADRTIRVWWATGRQDLAVLNGHTGAVVGLAFAPNGRRLASLSIEHGHGYRGDDTVRLWDLDPRATLPVLRGHTSYVYPVAFSPDGRWLASGSWDGTACLWDGATGEPCAALPHPGIVSSLAYSPDGTRLVSESYGDRRLRIWDAATARVHKEIPDPAGSLPFVTASPDGSRDSTSPRVLRELIQDMVIVSPDGRRAAATAYDHKAKFHLGVRDLASGERLFAAEGAALAYSPDGRWLAVRAADETTVLLLDARTYQTAGRFLGHEKGVVSATFSPDSRCLASCGLDRTVRLWPIDGGACRVLRGHTDDVFAAAFHPDGTRLATAGRDGAVWLWDLARGEEVARLPGHTSYIWSLAFSPDGATLASGSGDFTVRLWDTTPLKARYRARREAAALRREAERLVERSWKPKGDPAEVIEMLRADPTLSEPLRHAARLAVLRRAMPPGSGK